MGNAQKRQTYTERGFTGTAGERREDGTCLQMNETPQVAQMVQNRPAMRETWFSPWAGKMPWRRNIYLFVSAFSHFSGWIYSLELGQGQRETKAFLQTRSRGHGCVCVCVCVCVWMLCVSVCLFLGRPCSLLLDLSISESWKFSVGSLSTCVYLSQQELETNSCFSTLC